MSQTGGNSKATFTGLDDGTNFTVQYNPKEFKVDKAVSWEETQTQGQSGNFVQFQKGSPMTASMDLYFDTTNSDPPGNVQTEWVGPLIALTKATVQPAQGEAKELSKKRPPSLLFQWGDFNMKCVVESINTTFLMFASDGRAVRARCTVKLKEWKESDLGSGGGGGSGWSSEAVQLVSVQGGQTLSQVASSSGADMRAIAEYNNITDPMADLTGMTLSIPTR
jgi:Contractile injection system tube protein